MPAKRTTRPLTENPPLSLGRRLMRFAVALAVFILVVYGLAPLPIKYFAPMAHYAAEAEAYGIQTGALYYNDLPVATPAEMHSRNTVSFVRQHAAAEAASQEMRQ